VGNSVLIRTVTSYFTGRVVALTESEVILQDAAWVADAGRFSAALTTGSLSEVEPYPSEVSVGRGAIVDVTTWSHALPRDVR
jgi:hypothetical protein